MSNDALLHKYQDMVDKLKTLTDDLGWDYERMSSSGQETLDEIYTVLGMQTISQIEQEIKDGKHK